MLSTETNEVPHKPCLLIILTIHCKSLPSIQLSGAKHKIKLQEINESYENEINFFSFALKMIIIGVN